MAAISAALVGCAAQSTDVRILASIEGVASERAFATPPPGGPAIVEVTEHAYANATSQDIILSGSGRSTGQNILHVALYLPADSTAAPEARLPDAPLAYTDIGAELEKALPGIDMRISDNFAQNAYGPFGYALGRATGTDLCLYAWQRIRGPERASLFPRRGTIAIRLRLCEPDASEAKLLRVIYGLHINAYVPSPDWNPYGDPRPADPRLGQLGTSIYPDAAIDRRGEIEPGEPPRGRLRARAPRRAATEPVAEAPPPLQNMPPAPTVAIPQPPATAIPAPPNAPVNPKVTVPPPPRAAAAPAPIPLAPVPPGPAVPSPPAGPPAQPAPSP